MSILHATPTRSNRRRKVVREFGEGIFEEVDRTDLDRAWDLGFYIGRNDLPGIACPDWPEMMADAFYEGVGAGQARREHDQEEEFRSELGMLAAMNTPEGRDLW